MDLLLPLGSITGLVVIATALGLAWRAARGRTSKRSAGEIVEPATLGADAVTGWGRDATLVQFSTEFCSTCPQTRRVLAAEAAAHPGVAHVDVDVTDRPDLVTRFSLLQTPTTLLVDAAGVVRARWGGAVRPPLLRESLRGLLSSASAHQSPASAHEGSIR
ncbi:thioredoxin family protein [Cnuibacter physcomitrellae]|uniref:TlpA family protein disulfide reductase n=1 Tax=Cnuibacter physcomitrellae TaxID=1619308 RepID=UPI0021758D9F|nr:thioredoxin family protein [Cnuibacter physcomitrellae]MCS5496775.1 thioredoxin family protein [Cnuibacter physcomitrellae]